jgi:hypothetical protein
MNLEPFSHSSEFEYGGSGELYDSTNQNPNVPTIGFDPQAMFQMQQSGGNPNLIHINPGRVKSPNQRVVTVTTSSGRVIKRAKPPTTPQQDTTKAMREKRAFSFDDSLSRKRGGDHDGAMQISQDQSNALAHTSDSAFHLFGTASVPNQHPQQQMFDGHPQHGSFSMAPAPHANWQMNQTHQQPNPGNFPQPLPPHGDDNFQTISPRGFASDQMQVDNTAWTDFHDNQHH